jgi:D-apionolactonase
MSESRSLRAGPLQATFTRGELRHIRFGGSEIVQRIYGAVRDKNWATIPGILENVNIHVEPRKFRILFDSVHQQGEIYFSWRGTITGTESGSISFAMDGKANSKFRRNRIGLCVHHPLRECRGKPCIVQATDGALEETWFPEFVSPHQPFLNVRAISYQVAPGVHTAVRFFGEVFETEDHRNWTDANFKTYGTPLQRPFPVEMTAGTEIHQRIEVTLQGFVKSTESLPERIVHVRSGNSLGFRLPRIGLSIASDGRATSEADRELLSRLNLSHLRVDLPLNGGATPGLTFAAAEAKAIGAKLEAAVTLPGETKGLKDFASIVARWLIYHETDKSTGEGAARELRAVLGPKACLVVGSNACFAELNRNRPEGNNWHAACFSVNPQVHVFDDEGVMGNASAQFDAVKSARYFLGGKPVVISPVTLRPRFPPNAMGVMQPLRPDPRQKLPFCAAWTVASLKALAEAGTASVTYFETHGAGGVLDGRETYPVYSVFEAVGEFAGGQVIACESGDDSRVAALALESGGKRRIFIANLSDAECEIDVDGSSEIMRLAAYSVRCFDSRSD